MRPIFGFFLIYIFFLEDLNLIYFCILELKRRKDKHFKKLILENFEQGLADHKHSLGAPLCPCRLVSLLSSSSCQVICIWVDCHNILHIGAQHKPSIFKCLNFCYNPSSLGWLHYRHYDDKTAEVQQGFWNCPCVPMRERYDIFTATKPCNIV